MTSQATFWAIAGFMAGLAAAFFVLRLWQRQGVAPSGRKQIATLAGVLVFFIGAIWLYLRVGQPAVMSNTTVTQTPWPEHASMAVAGKQQAGSMADAINALRKKLSAGQGSDADWQLLQQSYQFMGDSAAAELAAQHRLSDEAGADLNAAKPATPATDFKQSISRDLVIYQQRVAKHADDAQAWAALASGYRSLRQFDAANDAFEHLIALKAMDADAWADYADSAASRSGTLGNAQSRQALTNALKMNPNHPKALWLQASLLLEQKQYSEALKTWQRLRAVIPDSSADAKIIDANIAEANALAGGKSIQAGSVNSVSVQSSDQASVQASVQGSINLDASLKTKALGKTLFVFAKSADSPAPVAVFRITVEKWPVSFTLDDSQAMMPTRKLSHFAQVQVQARLSQSGQAMPQPGDWQSDAQTVTTRQGKAITLIINKPVS